MCCFFSQCQSVHFNNFICRPVFYFEVYRLYCMWRLICTPTSSCPPALSVMLGYRHVSVSEEAVNTSNLNSNAEYQFESTLKGTLTVKVDWRCHFFKAVNSIHLSVCWFYPRTKWSMRLNGQILLGFGTIYHPGPNQQAVAFSICPFKMVLLYEVAAICLILCAILSILLCLKVKAIGQEGQQNLLDTDWHPQPRGHATAESCPSCPSELMYLTLFWTL